MQYIVSFLIGYLFGCLNLAYVLSKKNGIDFQKSGSGNLGASNTVIHLGAKAGAIVAIHDILKSIIAINIIRLIYPTNIIVLYVAGVATVIGHIFPFWLHFKAGKGFASYIGLAISTLKIQYIIIIFIICIVLILITDYIVAATFTTISITPIFTYLMTQNIICTCIVLIATIIIFLKHIENIKRIRNKEESHIKSTLFKKK